jgi:GNAT superfamily N-acetyltransferase
LSDLFSSLLIRDANLGDLPTIVEFNRRLALETEAKVLDLSVLAAGVSCALTDPQRLRYWVAELGSPANLVGQAAITREWSDWRNGWLWWLQSVYIALPYRGQGVFRAIYDHIRQDARSNSDVIGLRLYVEDANQQAQSTYHALGMKPGGYSVYEELWTERFQDRSGAIARES